ncbi:MAG: hypothetical protein K2J99_17900 [Lachnospiraceae bacterium]|nr:hypothetical protein [Lachnospiraceae bacterium]
MSLVNQGSQPTSASTFLSDVRARRRLNHTSSTSSAWQWRLFFLLFVILFYLIEILWIEPVDGINDDWGMYSTLSGAYLGYPEAHVLFFLYPLAWLLSRLYSFCSYIPWFGIFQHGVQVTSLYAVYKRSMQIWYRHNSPDAVWKPALTFTCILFFIVDLNVISEAQYTTTAGLAAAAAVFCFITAKSGASTASFLKSNIPSFIFAWISYSMRQNIFYLMLPMAGMLWLSKWINAYRNNYPEIARKLLGFALILLSGMGILYGLNATAYSEQKWSDFRQINHYRERVGDFYTWPEYEECADALEELGITEEEYAYRRGGAPCIGHGMSVEDWRQMHDIARECYLARTSMDSRLKNIVKGSLFVFFYEDGMQPANVLVLLLMLTTLLLILVQHNYSALFVFILYFIGRMVSWVYVLYEGRFPKRIIQPLITMDYVILFGIILGFNLFKAERAKRYALVLPVVILLSIASLFITKNNIYANYRIHQDTWEELKAYCHSHPDNLYIWTYSSGTLENYCESPFDMTLDTYNNFIYTNWGVVCNPNTKTKLAKYGVENLGQDLIDSTNTYFILAEAPHNDEHPVIMYFRHTYNAVCEVADTFTAGDTVYAVYQLRKTE